MRFKHYHVLDLCPGFCAMGNVGDNDKRFGANHLLIQLCDEQVDHGLIADTSDGFLRLREGREIGGFVKLMVKLKKRTGVFFLSFPNDYV